MTISLEVVEGVQPQSASEEVAYSITTTPWGTGPTAVAVTAFQVGKPDVNVTSTVFPTNSPSVNGDIITLSLLKNLVKGNSYRIEVKFTCGSNVFECYFIRRCDF